MGLFSLQLLMLSAEGFCKGGYTLVTLPRIVTPYRDSVDETRARVKETTRLRPEKVWTCNVTLHVHTCSGRNRIISLMRLPNTDSTPNKPVTLGVTNF